MSKRVTVRPHATEAGARRAAEPSPSERRYALRITVNHSLYTKLMHARESLRREDGSPADLREVLELAIDTLLANSSVRPSGERPTVVQVDANEEPPTVRTPSTKRWHPSRNEPS
ncbi:MAG: hypothetical protein JW751_24675 [Polyangiaceae bacterium]|nr:hypothetical protein [Polyangiaceae bacterium]